jgi:hypothetical protein
MKKKVITALACTCCAVAFAQTETKLTASDAATGDYFGVSVSVSGDAAVIGAYGDNDAGDDTGSAYVFARDAGGTWAEQAKLTASDAGADDHFGRSVSVNGDTAVISAWRDDDGGTNSGAAYVFTRDAGGTWTQQAKLTASDAAADGLFGTWVSVNGDTAVIGALGAGDGGWESGAVYVFTRDAGGTWTEQVKLTASDADHNDHFGYSVSVDGHTAVIGAIGNDDDGRSSGSAYVFTRDAGGTWTEQAKLTASDAAADDLFGWSVSVNGDAAVIGAYGDDDGGDRSGSAYVFTRDAGGTWTEQTKLTASDAASLDYLGGSVSVDGATAVIGAERDDDGGLDSGSAYVYTGPPIPVELQLFTVE